MKWFKHDSNANGDAKLRRVRIKYGMQGYGLYWYCLELVAQNVDKHNLTFELEHDAEIIAHDTGIHMEMVQEIMTYMANLGLFEESSGHITCLKMAARADEYTQTIMRRSPDTLPTVSRPPPDKLPVNRIDRTDRTDRKNKKKVTKRKRFKPPTVDDVAVRCMEMEYKVDPQRFCDFYGSKDWMVGKNKMTDWHRALAGWNSREGKQQPLSGSTRKTTLAEDLRDTSWA